MSEQPPTVWDIRRAIEDRWVKEVDTLRARVAELEDERDAAIRANASIIGVEREGARILAAQRDGAERRVAELERTIRLIVTETAVDYGQVALPTQAPNWYGVACIAVDCDVFNPFGVFDDGKDG